MEGIDLSLLRKFDVVWLELLSIVDRMEEPLTKNLCNEDDLPLLNQRTLSYDDIPSFILLRFHFLCYKIKIVKVKNKKTYFI